MKTVLAVDDSETMQKMMRQILEMGGHQVVIAGNGVEAIEKFKQQPFDLVLTDVNMPEMDGITLIKELRVLSADIPILTVTTESERSIRQEGAQAGANGWIVKPIRAQQLIDIIRQMMTPVGV